MKESNLPFSVLRTYSCKRTVESAFVITARNQYASVNLDFCIKLSDSYGNGYNTNNLTLNVEEISAFIEHKTNHLVYDKIDGLTDDEKLFIGFTQAAARYWHSVLNEFIVMALKNATIEIDVTTIKSTGNFSYATDVVTIKDIVFDKEVVEKVIENATKGRGN